MNEIQRLIHEMCPDGVPMVALGEVCEIKNGKDYKHLSPGNIPVWGTGGIMTYVDQYAYNGPSVLLPRKGSIDKVYYSEGPVWTVDTLFYTIINESKIKPKYLYAVISMQDLRALDTSKGNRPSLTQTVLNKIQIPLPPLPIQQRIVEILDKFTSLVSSLDSEIALRQKQYEYYQHRTLPVPVGEPFVAAGTGQAEAYKGQYQGKDVAQVVTGVGEKSQRMLPESHSCLHQHECQVEGDADQIYPAERACLLRSVMMVMMMFFVYHNGGKVSASNPPTPYPLIGILHGFRL